MAHPEKTYHERVIRISELAGDEGIVDGFEFTGCHIKGPAVLLPQSSTLANSEFRGDPDAILWEIPLSRTTVVGAILIQDCTFDDCVFENIGFAGPPEFIRNMRAGTSGF